MTRISKNVIRPFYPQLIREYMIHTVFQQAMDGGEHPEVGSDAAAADAAAADDELPDLCASYLEITGKDLNKKGA